MSNVSKLNDGERREARQIAEEVRVALGVGENNRASARLAADILSTDKLYPFEPATEQEMSTLSGLIGLCDDEGIRNYINIMLELRFTRGQRNGFEQCKECEAQGRRLADRVFRQITKDITAAEQVIDCRDAGGAA